jgi:hypothetical protein
MIKALKSTNDESWSPALREWFFESSFASGVLPLSASQFWQNSTLSQLKVRESTGLRPQVAGQDHMGSIELANRFKLSDFRPVHLFCERHHTSERRWIVTFGDGQRELD